MENKKVIELKEIIKNDTEDGFKKSSKKNLPLKPLKQTEVVNINAVRSTQRKQILSLDVGTSSVRAVIADVQEYEDRDTVIRVIGFGNAPARGLRKGVVINIESTVKSIKAALQQAETMAGIQINEAYLSISGSHIKCFNSLGVVAIRDKEVSRYDIQKVIDAAKAVAIPPDRELLHVIIQDYIIDGQDGIREPLGMSGVRLEARVHLVSGAISSAKNLVKCANKAGLHVKDLVFSPIAASMAVLTDSEKELGVCLIDIGAGTCDLSVYQNSSLIHSAVIPLGGVTISNRIAQHFRIPLVDAEKVKCKFGEAHGKYINQYECFEVLDTEASQSGADDKSQPRRMRCSKKELAEVIESALKDIFYEIYNHLQQQELLSQMSTGVVICGELSQLPELNTLVEEYFNAPVRIAFDNSIQEKTNLTASRSNMLQKDSSPSNTFNSHALDGYRIESVSEMVLAPEYSTCLGLLAHAGLLNKTHIKIARSRFSKLWGKAVNWLAEHF